MVAPIATWYTCFVNHWARATPASTLCSPSEGANPLLRRLFNKEEEKTEDDIRLEASLQKTRSGFLGLIGAIFQENEPLGDRRSMVLGEGCVSLAGFKFVGSALRTESQTLRDTRRIERGCTQILRIDADPIIFLTAVKRRQLIATTDRSWQVISSETTRSESP